MIDWQIRVGQKLIWEPDNPLCKDNVVVTEVAVWSDGTVWVQSDGRYGLAWNELSRMAEACVPME